MPIATFPPTEEQKAVCERARRELTDHIHNLVTLEGSDAGTILAAILPPFAALIGNLTMGNMSDVEHVLEKVNKFVIEALEYVNEQMDDEE